MRRAGTVATLALMGMLAACGSDREPSHEPSGSPATQMPATPVAASPAATDPDPIKRAALWLDAQTEPRRRGRYAPRDECGTLPGARAFRERLAAAVQARDADAIAAMASEDVKLDFGGGHGRERLLAKLRQADGALMAELASLLPLGCAGSDGGGLTAPWYFAQDFGDVDSYSAMLVTGGDVPLLAEPRAGSATKRRISWDLVMLSEGLKPDAPFQRVRSGGQAGYVATDRLRSLLDYRMLAVRQGEDWKITALIAGD